MLIWYHALLKYGLVCTPTVGDIALFYHCDDKVLKPLIILLQSICSTNHFLKKALWLH